MLPEDQRATFITVYADAFRLAQEGRISQGYVILDLGLDRAEQQRRAGVFWAHEVVGLYREALRGYVDRFGYPECWPAPESDSTLAVLARAVLAGRVIL
jgi:hypothetical protein